MKRSMRGIQEMTFAALPPHLFFALSENFLAAQSRPPRPAWVRFSRSTIATLAAVISLSCASAAYAQSGTLGSASSPVVNSLGQPMGGVDVAICQPLATTAAQVTSNTAVLTMATNPITAGFAAGMQIQVAGFSGADAYFNGGAFTNGTGITGGYTILSVTSTTIAYSLTRANATATTNGTVLQQGNSTTPCAGLSSVYSDAALTQAITQPITTDGLGNWNAFAATGSSQLFYVQFYGAGVTSSFRAMVVSMNGAALKPQPSDAVQCVSPNGNDANDGLGIVGGNCKQTIFAAYNALPAAGGTIYVTGGASGGTQVYCTPTSGQGFGIAGSLDPNYNSTPTVISNVQWVKAKAGPVAIIGLSAATFGVASSAAWMTTLHCGNSSTPSLWLSDVGNGFTLSYINLTDGSIAIRDGIDSTGNRGANSGASSTQEFSHLQLNAQVGPTFDGGGLLSVQIQDVSANNFGAQAPASNAASNFYFSTGGTGPFLGGIQMDNIEMNGGGGIRYDANTGVLGSIYARRIFMEGSGNSQPVFEIVNNGQFSANIVLEGGESDSGTNIPIVRVNPSNDPCNTNVSGINQHNVYAILEGPLTLGAGTCSPAVSGATPTYAELTPLADVIPAAKNQRGGPFGLSQAADSYRRAFGPSFVRFANLAAQNPASWTAGEGTSLSLTQIQGPGDPAGATNAATLNCTANGVNGGCDYIAYNNSITFNAGDYIYVGVWTQQASTAGLATCGDQFGCPLGVEMPTNPAGIRVMAGGPGAVGSIGTNGLTTCVFTCMFAVPYYQTDGNWQYLWEVAKVVTPASGATTIKLHLSFKNGFPLNAYAPMLARIPASSVALAAAPAFSSASEAGNNVTFTTTAAHNLYGAMPIVISGCSLSGYNGEWVVTGTPTATTFTLYNPASGLGAPSGCLITPGNDSEVADWANNLASYGDNCTSGTFCGIRGATVPKVMASGTSTLTNSAISSGACATVVTTSASGTLASDRIEWSYASAPGTADGLLTLNPYVTSGNVNWKLCNPTASSQTPSGLVVNWEVLR